MSTQPKRFATHQPTPLLTYYIRRSNGDLVPLIPADQLPSSIHLSSIPRILRSDQVFGLRCVGELPDTEGLTFQLENNLSAVRTFSNSPTGLSHRRECSTAGPIRSLNPEAPPHRPSTANGPVPYPSPQSSPLATRSPPPTRHKPGDGDSFLNALMNTEQGARRALQVGYIPKTETPLPPSGNKINPDQKKYCTHWIRHGECDYIQQGCRYLHVMPDLAILNSIGFKCVPRWYLEENAKVRLSAKPAGVGPLAKASSWLKSISGEDAKRKASDGESPKTEGSNGDFPALAPGYRKSVSEVSRSSIAQWRTSAAVVKNDEPGIQLRTREGSAVGDLIDLKESDLPSSQPTTNGAAKAVNEGKKPEEEGVSATQTDTPTSKPRSRPSLNVSTPAAETSKNPCKDASKETKSGCSSQSQQSSISEPRGPPPKIFGRQKGRLNQNRRNQGIMASMHAPAENGESTGHSYRPCRGRGDRFRIPTASESAVGGLQTGNTE